jgi:hypothetical protein
MHADIIRIQKKMQKKQQKLRWMWRYYRVKKFIVNVVS